MKIGTLYLPGFHLSTLRRKPRSGAQKLADEKIRIRRHTISQLGECFGSFIPVSYTHLVRHVVHSCDGQRLFLARGHYRLLRTAVGADAIPALVVARRRRAVLRVVATGPNGYLDALAPKAAGISRCSSGGTGLLFDFVC